MPLAIGLAVALGFSIDEALWAATVGSARSLGLHGRAPGPLGSPVGLQGRVGVLEPGATADLVAWDAAHEGDFALRLGRVGPLRTWVGGQAAD